MQHISGIPGLQRGKIVNKSTILKLSAVDNIIRTAQQTAEEILQKAQMEAGEIREHAQQQGYVEGMVAFDKVNRRFDDAREAMKSHVLGLLQECLGDFLSTVPREYMLELMLGSAMQTIPAINSVLTLHVASEDFESAKLAISSWRAKSGTSTKINVEVAVELQSSECRLYSGTDVIETSLKIITDGLISDFYDESASGWYYD